MTEEVLSRKFKVVPVNRQRELFGFCRIFGKKGSGERHNHLESLTY